MSDYTFTEKFLQSVPEDVRQVMIRHPPWHYALYMEDSSRPDKKYIVQFCGVVKPQNRAPYLLLEMFHMSDLDNWTPRARTDDPKLQLIPDDEQPVYHFAIQDFYPDREFPISSTWPIHDICEPFGTPYYYTADCFKKVEDNEL